MKAFLLNAAAGLIRSADFQSAVSQILNLPGARHSGGSRIVERAADCKSAIQQTTRLRYMAAALRRSKACGPALKARNSSAQGKALGSRCSVSGRALEGRNRIALLQGLARTMQLISGSMRALACADWRPRRSAVSAMQFSKRFARGTRSCVARGRATPHASPGLTNVAPSGLML
jgi:hypothetical protein